MKQFYRDTWIEVDLDKVENNVKNLRSYLPEDVEIMTVVKAKGNGHGAVQVGKIALASGATSLGVAIMDEAVALRDAGITAPILVMGAVNPRFVDKAVEENIMLSALSPGWLREAKVHKKKSEPIQIHIPLDTGLGRLGMRTKEELEDFAKNLCHNFSIKGTFTHFATANEKCTEYLDLQYNRLKELLHTLRELNVSPGQVHCGNSAATLRFPHKLFDTVRTGAITYGIPSFAHQDIPWPFEKKPVLSLYSRLSHVKLVPAGEAISYGNTYVTKEPEWIGTLPIGYADGLARSMQGFSLLIDGKKVEIVGRVCMDQCMVRLPKEMPVGTVVTIIGEDGKEKITVEDIANYRKTMSMEVVSTLGARIPRVYKKDGEVVEVMNLLLG